jgi:hypothetical protein
MVYKWRVDQLEARVTEQERRLQTIQRLETEFDHVGKSLEKMEKTLSDLNGSVIDRLARLEERVKNQWWGAKVEMKLTVLAASSASLLIMMGVATQSPKPQSIDTIGCEQEVLELKASLGRIQGRVGLLEDRLIALSSGDSWPAYKEPSESKTWSPEDIHKKVGRIQAQVEEMIRKTENQWADSLRDRLAVVALLPERLEVICLARTLTHL